MDAKRAIVIIDGSNLYHKLKSLEFRNLADFKYDRMVRDLIAESRLINKYFCIGKIQAKQNDNKARKMMAEQQKLLAKLKKSGFQIQLGYLLKSEGMYREKGTDVQIAVNLMKGAYRDDYDVAFLISSDSDLIPAINEVKENGKEITYVGFMHQPSFALLKACTHSRLLAKKDLNKYLPK